DITQLIELAKMSAITVARNTSLTQRTVGLMSCMKKRATLPRDRPKRKAIDRLAAVVMFHLLAL
ncbi:hypothetical protein CVV67_26740, partial [Arthrobacter stackebrandtii]